MKKIIIILALCVVMVSMPALNALSVNNTNSKIDSSETINSINKQGDEESDGTFVGGLGRIYKENGEWTYDTYSYLIGVYNGNKIHAKIYNLDEEEIGSITVVFRHKLILGRIQNIDGKKAPIIGFLFWNEENFAGRIMSLFGPAPHIYGEYTPK